MEHCNCGTHKDVPFVVRGVLVKQGLTKVWFWSNSILASKRGQGYLGITHHGSTQIQNPKNSRSESCTALLSWSLRTQFASAGGWRGRRPARKAAPLFPSCWTEVGKSEKFSNYLLGNSQYLVKPFEKNPESINQSSLWFQISLKTCHWQKHCHLSFNITSPWIQKRTAPRIHPLPKSK